MHRDHVFEYTPILTGVKQRYILALPVDLSPLVYRTMTTNMASWDGEVLWLNTVAAGAVIWHSGQLHKVSGCIFGKLDKGGPCSVLEHLNVDGEMDFIITDKENIQTNDNYVNFGIRDGKHMRIDIYTGEYRIINGN